MTDGAGISPQAWALDQEMVTLEDCIDKACAEIERLRAQRDELLAALKQSIETIRVWHGMGIAEPLCELEIHAWELYQASPEMRRINMAIAQAEGR